jgi:hypothetical protein
MRINFQTLGVTGSQIQTSPEKVRVWLKMLEFILSHINVNLKIFEKGEKVVSASFFCHANNFAVFSTRRKR